LKEQFSYQTIHALCSGSTRNSITLGERPCKRYQHGNGKLLDTLSSFEKFYFTGGPELSSISRTVTGYESRYSAIYSITNDVRKFVLIYLFILSLSLDMINNIL